MEKMDFNKVVVVVKLCQFGNEWVVKYCKVKKVVGKFLFSNMYFVINVISGYYVSFGVIYFIFVKCKDCILDEVKDVEKVFNCG